MTYIFGTLLTAGGKLRTLNIIAGTSVLVNIVLNLILIPEQGAYGAAIASFFTQAVTAVCQIILVFRLLPVSFKTVDIFRITIFSLTLVLIAYIPVLQPVHWSIQFMFIIVSGGALGLITGMISLRGITRILQSN